MQQAFAVGQAFGFRKIRVAEYPGQLGVHELDTRLKNYEEVLLPQIIKLLTEPVKQEGVEGAAVPRPREIVFRGSFETVNEFFRQNLWGDGLPVVPPTIDKIEQFMKYTDRYPDEVLGVFLPGNCEVTAWKVAVNGVMAGCRPEYMPVLIAIAEAMADNNYRIQDAGSTPGWEAIIILNGPIRNQLGFNCKEAVLRPGYQANTSIGRFYRLLCRNLARLLPGTTDQATYGQPFRPVLPENEEVCARIGWKPLSVLRGFNANENVVTILGIRAMSDPLASNGESAERHLDYIIDWVKRMIEPYRAARPRAETFSDTTGAHLLIVSPVIASVLAAGRYSKEDVKQYILKHAVIPAHEFERNCEWFYGRPFDLCEAVQNGILPKEWCQSADPNRLVPVMPPATDWLVVVSGGPERNRSLICRQNFEQGYPVSKKISLPANWDDLMRGLGKLPWTHSRHIN